MSANITTKQTTTLNVDESNQNWVVNIGGSIVVANGHGIVNSGAFTDSVIAVSGDVVADATYRSGIQSSGADAILQVDTMGSIHGYNGIAFYGDGTYAENLGTITATNIGIYANAVHGHVLNAGQINAAYGIYVDKRDFNGTVAENSGVITADHGVLATHGSFLFTNLSGGEIHSKTVGVSFGGDVSTENNRVVNEGLIESGGVAIQGSLARDAVENSGTIKGAILLGGGDDVFDNRGGTIDHAVDGGAGNDKYIFGATAFAIVDSGGSDSIGTEITRTLAAFPSMENLELLGVGNINGTGNAMSNVINGNDGSNVLDGGNDNVVDTLLGGKGDDTYVLRSGMDVVFDSGGVDGHANQGTDTIVSGIGRNLGDYENVENLTIVGPANAAGTGNELANLIVGNSGRNTLSGGVEWGNVVDTLNGGAGDDTYVLGSGHDVVIDGSGVDTITSSIARSLASYATIENLRLTGSSNVNGAGNGSGNALTGNSGMNTLSGGAGDDVLIGGGGADKLDGGGNLDTASYAGAALGVVARLAAASANAGDAKGDSYVSIENLTGSSHDDTLGGNGGANVLRGGTGADTMTGGAGADTFAFAAVGESGPSASERDTILDFHHGEGDRISLSAIDANPAISGDQAFVFKGTAAFSGTKGEVHFEKQASDSYVVGDVNGDKVADFMLHFDDALSFQASDFLL